MKTVLEHCEETMFSCTMDIVDDLGKAKAIEVLQGLIDWLEGEDEL